MAAVKDINFRDNRKKLYFYAGTYTQPILFGTGEVFQGKGKGIYFISLDPDSETLSVETVTEGIENPSFFCLSPDRKYLYAVNELKRYRDRDSGSVSAFEVDPESGSLRFLNARPTNGTDPCHVNINDARTKLYVTNYMSGSICTYPILEDGSIGEASQFIQHEGRSVVESRQSGPHAHSLVFTRDQKFALVSDLGMDKVMSYAIDPQNGTLTPSVIPFYQAHPGSGPRFCAFHPNWKFLYVVNELSSSVTLLYFDPDSGVFDEKQTIRALPEAYDGESSCADLHITPNGKYLYCSNRGHNSLTEFAIDPVTGFLSCRGNTSCGGEVPRNFCIDQSGTYLLAANQDSDNIVLFSISQKDGSLTRLSDLAVPSPVCIREF